MAADGAHLQGSQPDMRGPGSLVYARFMTRWITHRSIQDRSITSTPMRAPPNLMTRTKLSAKKNLWRSSKKISGEWNKGLLRASARGERCDRRRDLCPRDSGWVNSANFELFQSRSRVAIWNSWGAFSSKGHHFRSKPIAWQKKGCLLQFAGATPSSFTIAGLRRYTSSKSGEAISVVTIAMSTKVEKSAD
jgi:hypothetical protein